MNLPGPLSEQHWQILTTLWDLGRPASQRELIHELTLRGVEMDWRVHDVQLRRLVERGFVKRLVRSGRGTGRPWRFEAACSRDDLLRSAVGEFLEVLPVRPGDRDLVLEMFDARVVEEELDRTAEVCAK